MLPKGPYGIKMEDTYIFKDLPLLSPGHGTRQEWCEQHLLVEYPLAWAVMVSRFCVTWATTETKKKKRNNARAEIICLWTSPTPLTTGWVTAWPSSTPWATGICTLGKRNPRAAALGTYNSTECAQGSKQSLDYLILPLHADHCSESQGCLSGCHELPVRGMPVQHKSEEPEGHKSPSFLLSLASSLSKTLTSCISLLKERNQSSPDENENPNLICALDGILCDKIHENL